MSSRFGRRFAGLILLPAGLGLLALALLAGDFTWRWDFAVYDAVMRLRDRPAPSDVVLVAVDKESLDRFGRWPWPRRLHAELIDKLREAGAAAIGIDVLFVEPDAADPAGDAALAAAIRRAGKTVLPVVIEQHRLGGQPMESLPLPALIDAAAALGHVGVEIDPDGVVRSAYLYEGVGTAHWPHFSLALLAATGGRSPPPPPHEDGPASPFVEVRAERALIPFVGAPGAFWRASYAQVIDGRFLPTTFAGKIVLVGVTALGAGDIFPTPVSGHDQHMAGVELNANLLQALRDGNVIRELGFPVQAAASVVFAAAAGLLVLMLAPRAGFVAMSVLVVALLALTATLLLAFNAFLRPLSGVLCVALSYPLASLVRLELAMHYLDHELERLHAKVAERWPWLIPAGRRTPSGDAVVARMRQVQDASAQLDQLQQFVQDSLEQMANGVLVTNAEREVTLANRRALSYLHGSGMHEVTGHALEAVMARLTAPEPFEEPPAERNGQGWHMQLRASDGRELLAVASPLRLGRREAQGLIVNLVDISDLKQAERQRSEAVEFLSHDLRSPLFSILAVIDSARAADTSAAPLLDRVEAYARRAVHLSESFLWLARAESRETAQDTEVDLVELCESSLNHVAAAAAAKRIHFERQFDALRIDVRADRELLERALVNLIDNAVKHSPASAAVTVGAAYRNGEAVCFVADHGAGIATEDLPKLFGRFTRLSPAHLSGAGLGLAYVKAVAERFGGKALASSVVGEGSRFEIRLPALRSEV